MLKEREQKNEKPMPNGNDEYTAQKCLDILREIKDAAFATVDEFGKPQIRIIDVMLVENEKMYFCTARGKDFYRQLTACGDVAVTGLTGDWKMIRLNGRADRLPEQKYWIDRIFEHNPSMNQVYPGESRYILEPFVIDEGKIEIFDLGKNPIFRQTFFLGQAVRKNENREEEDSVGEKGDIQEEAAGTEDSCPGKGFQITDACIACGRCAKSCPQQCITPGTPYHIEQEHCLHCGLCREVCPAGAIRKISPDNPGETV